MTGWLTANFCPNSATKGNCISKEILLNTVAGQMTACLQVQVDFNIPRVVLAGTDWSFQVLTWVSYLWLAEEPKSCLDVLLLLESAVCLAVGLIRKQVVPVVSVMIDRNIHFSMHPGLLTSGPGFEPRCHHVRWKFHPAWPQLPFA